MVSLDLPRPLSNTPLSPSLLLSFAHFISHFLACTFSLFPLNHSTPSLLHLPCYSHTQNLKFYQTKIVSGPEYEGRVIGYYKLKAIHHRRLPFESKFTGHLQHVHVMLPKKSPPKDQTYRIATNIGQVFSLDHLSEVRSLESFNEFIKPLGFEEVDRVDYIGPARRLGGHFMAVAVYVGYRGGQPSVYVPEAGTAKGTSASLYPVAPGKWSKTPKGYTPTAFTKVEDIYHSQFKMTDPSEGEYAPLHLTIKSFVFDKETKQPASDPYITVNIHYEKTFTSVKEYAKAPYKEMFTAFARMSWVQKGE